VAAGQSEKAAPFVLEKGDRIVLLGNGFIEQERHHAHMETRLVSRHPDLDLSVRNLGWGGDTVRGTARTSGYQNPEGLARLIKEVQDHKPTVLVLGYGMNESFAGPAGLAAFIEDYEQLLAKLGPLKTRIVLLSPTLHEDLGRPLPDPAEHNRDLEEYTMALTKLTARRKILFVDLFHPLRAAKKEDAEGRLTTNGILLTETGYSVVARALQEQLRLPAHCWRVELDASGKVLAAKGTKVEKVTIAEGVLRFRALDAVLPIARVGSVAGDELVLRVVGLRPGMHVLSVDGTEVARAAAEQWQKGVAITTGPAFDDLEKLRSAIVRRNELFYRRWRPFNDHSRHWDFMRGDYGLYDKEIAEQEQVIATARRPRPHSFELAAKGGAK
jgi:lysophospholipase L1-like esterase